MWIDKELLNRANSGKPQLEDVTRCLIKLPEEKPPIVLFNEEAAFDVVGRKAPGKDFEYGQEMYLHDIRDFSYALPPKSDEKPVAFVFLMLIEDKWHMFFDFHPAWPEKPTISDYRNWKLGRLIAESCNLALKEKLVKAYPNYDVLLERVGLWMAPSLIPYPISQILYDLSNNGDNKATETLTTFCNPQYLQELVMKWWDLEPFVQRKEAIEEALDSHTKKKHVSSIHVLVPMMEGIITDYLVTTTEKVPWKGNTKIKKFLDDALPTNSGSFIWRRTAESTANFLTSGPVFDIFKQWKERIDTRFANRHVVSHGRYDKSLFNEQNSIKIFLLLDSIYFLIKGVS
jgi:hypothetical protein